MKIFIVYVPGNNEWEDPVLVGVFKDYTTTMLYMESLVKVDGSDYNKRFMVEEGLLDKPLRLTAKRVFYTLTTDNKIMMSD